MNAGEVRHRARGWVESNRGRWPGLRAAHLVGSITTTPDDAPFPAYRDVDMHLIFDEGSSMLEAPGPFLNVIEVPYQGLLVEAGIKSIREYESAEAVLANPEIAHHLTVDSVLYDPSGLLGRLQDPVRREFRCRRWVDTRVEHERNGLRGALALLPMARATWGAAGEVNILGYSFTFVGALFAVAALKSPSTGSRFLLRMRETLAEYDHLDLYDEVLEVLGLRDAGPARTAQLLHEGTEAFDLAVQVRHSPHPFQHKLHEHLRPYFVDSCQSLLDEGYHREALGWVLPFYTAATDVVLADGPEEVKERFAERYAGFLEDLGMDTAASRAARFDRANRLYERCFALASEITASY
jgi:hypothetical protein